MPPLLPMCAAAPPAAAASLVLVRRFAAMHAPRAVLGRLSGPSTAATGSPSGLGNFGGAKADSDDKFPQGAAVPAALRGGCSN